MHQEKKYETGPWDIPIEMYLVSYIFSWCIYVYVLNKTVPFYPLHRIDKYLTKLNFIDLLQWTALNGIKESHMETVEQLFKHVSTLVATWYTQSHGFNNKIQRLLIF